MSRPLAIHQITAMEASPVELVSIAAELGCQQVCVFTHSPHNPVPGEEGAFVFPLVDEGNKREFLMRLGETGVGVGNVEFFPVQQGLDLEFYRAGLALGGEIGAKRAVTHIHDAVDSRAVDTLGALCDMALGYGLTMALEFMGLTPACNSVERAAWFVEQVRRPNLGIGVDALHLVRTGGTPAHVAAIPAEYFVYAQICDGAGRHLSADYLPEAMSRLLPGDGDFPLQDMIEALPAHTALDVEIPMPERAAAGVSAIERAREAVARSRAVIEAAVPRR